MKTLQFNTIARRLSIVVLTACLLGAIAPSGALAQADASKAKRAQQAFDEGMSHYTEKEYGKAITEFRKGYALMPAGMFLYNIALSYIKLGDYTKAQRYAKRADEREDLPKKVHVKNAARIDALAIRLHAAAVAGTMEPGESDAQAGLFGGEDPKGSQAGPPESEGGVGLLTYAGVGTAVVGVGLVGGALYMSSDLDTRIDQLALVSDRGDYDAMRSSIESDRTVGQVLLVSGVGLAAVGGGLLVWDLMGSGEPSGEISLQPQIGATTGARVQWSW